jgi:hypothetical protein
MSAVEWMLRGKDANHARTALSAEEKKYLALLSDYCLLAELDDPQAALTGEEFMVDGVDFRLIYVPEQQPDILGIWCDVGDIPEEREEQCYRDLLHANATRYDGLSPVMALCEETGTLMCCARLPLQALSAAALHQMIGAMATDARQWQRTM